MPAVTVVRMGVAICGVLGVQFLIRELSTEVSASEAWSIGGCQGGASKNFSKRRFFRKDIMEHDETGCQTREGPILCINNCGFFGSAATMNMCSKCHRDLVVKQEQEKLAVSSINSIVNGSSSNGNEPIVMGSVDVAVSTVEQKIISSQSSDASPVSVVLEQKAKEGPNRCNMCKKRVGLTGFSCRCGNLFCDLHRYSDKHNCSYDYRTAAQDAIAKANPVVKAEKLDKI